VQSVLETLDGGDRFPSRLVQAFQMGQHRSLVGAVLLSKSSDARVGVFDEPLAPEPRPNRGHQPDDHACEGRVDPRDIGAGPDDRRRKRVRPRAPHAEPLHDAYRDEPQREDEAAEGRET